MPHAIISRADAKAAGLNRFFTGEPCIHGHISERRVSGTAACMVCVRISRAVDRISRYEAIKATKAAWHKANKEKIRARRAILRAADPAAQRARTAKSYVDNREYFIAKAAAWYKADPKRWRAAKAVRRARKLSAGGRHTAKELGALLERQKSRCANSLCKASLKKGYHADHIIPLSLGGGNSIRNIQLLCAPCNIGKGAQHPIDWAQSHGALL